MQLRKLQYRVLLFTFLMLNINGAGGCTNCATCDASGCTSACCSNCYQLISGGITYCQLCQNGCATCSGAGSQLCTSCDPYYYLIPSGAGAYCQQCGANCLCATTWNNCVGCADGYFLTGSTCSPCSGCSKCAGSATNCTDCNTNQYMNGMVCTNCPSACLTCTSSTNCQTCKDAAHMSVPTCDCNSGYYLSGSSCSQCQLPCATCTSLTLCQSCSGSQITLVVNSCICDSGYVLISGVCQQCTSPCATCSTTQTYCDSCVSGLISVSGVCNCPSSGEYYDASFVCWTCQSPCSQCSASATHCTACSYTNMTPDANNVCVCDPGYYLNVNQCSQCIAPCTRCLTSVNCTQCQATGNWIYNAPTQSCICSPGYFLNGSVCDQCSAPCATCDTSALSCLSCVDPVSQDLTASPVCDCRIGYVYSSPTSCLQCVLPCTACTVNVNTCTQCIDANHILSSNICVCSSGFGTSGTGCAPCQAPCLTCSTSVSTCSSCVDTSIFRLENNLCLCQDGYFAQGDQCQKCDPQCKTCLTYQDYCITCSDLNHILTASNECICDIGHFQSAGSCVQCQQPCFQCSINPNNCTECLDIYANLINNQCICQDGYYMDGDSICEECNVQCLTCSSQNACLTCPIYFYLTVNQNCNICQSPCSECTGLNTCINCVAGFILNVDQCVGCQLGCQYCNSLLDCQQCYDGYYLNLQNICMVCQEPCQTCVDNATKCLTCQDNQQQIINNVCVCKSGYYQSGDQCLECDYPCMECSSKAQCLSCQPISQIQLVNNQCLCQDGYFYNFSQCLICDMYCLKCQDQADNCISCDPYTNRVLDKATNNCVCQNQYFSENNQIICQQCSSTNGIQYEECKYENCGDGYWTYGEQCDDGNTISRDGCTNCLIDQGYSCSNYILEPSLCYKCLDNCIDCDLNSQCIQCQSGYYLQDQNCKMCSDKCKTCSSNLICLECKYLKLNNQCVYCDQKVGYYLNEDQDSCITKCGDDILADTEECDDGNQLSFDGCNQLCQLEKDFYLSPDGQIIKGQYPVPYLIETYQSYYDNRRIFQLQYEQLIQDFNYKNLEQNILVSIKEYFINKDNDMQLLDQSFISKQNLWNVSILITINLYQTTIQKNISVQYLNVSIIKNQQNLEQQVIIVQQLISDFQQIDQSTIKNTQSAISANSYMLYIILALVLLSILFGGIEIFFNLLDLLQLVSYLQYINTQFPYNLDAFIQLFQFAQFKLLDDYISLQQYYSDYIDSSIEPPAKINNDGYQTNILYNISSLIVVWASFIATYVLAHLLPIVMQKIDIKFNMEKDKQFTIWIKSIILVIKQYLQKFCFIIRRSFIFSGFFRTYISTTYDFCFFLMLSIYALQFNNDLNIQISSYMTLLLIVLFVIVILLALNAVYPQPYQLMLDKDRFGALYEGVKLDQLSKYYNIFLIMKKFFFMASLVLLYDNPLFQIFNIVMLSVIQLLYLFKIPMEEVYEQRKQLLCELYMNIMEIIILIFVIDDYQNLFVYDTRSQFGWICIGCITFMLMTQIVLDVHQQWSILIKIFKKIKKYIQQRFIPTTQEDQYTTNPNNLFQF